MELKNINEILIDLILSEDDDENIIMLNNMLINGLDPNISFSFDENGSRKTFLEYCCRFNKIGYVNLLIKNNVNLEVFSEDGETPLHILSYSILENESNIDENKVYELIIKKIKHLINHRDKDGRTALMLAVKSGAKNKIDLLIKNGAKINLLDNFKNNCLHYIFLENNPINLQMEILDILINYGANPLQVNEANMTPIDNYLILHPALSSTAFSKVIDTQKYEKVKNSMM